jgi:hypothetical protein
LRKPRAIGTAAGVSLVAITLMLAPAWAASGARSQQQARAVSFAGRPVGSFTPAVSDPRLAATLARRRLGSTGTEFRFTPTSAFGDRSRGLRVAVRARQTTPAQASRDAGPASSSAVTAITPSSYNLGVSVGWRRFAVSGDVAQADNGLIAGIRESAQVGMSYRATRRLTGRVAVGAERAQGGQRIIAEDQAYSLDVGGAYSISRNVDLTAGARYRIARDRLDPLSRDDRRDSQAVYVGTAFRF